MIEIAIFAICLVGASWQSYQSGIKEVMTILKTLNNFGTVEFNYDDIVRSGLVKQYIMAKDKINDNLHTLRSA